MEKEEENERKNGDRKNGENDILNMLPISWDEIFQYHDKMNVTWLISIGG